MNTMTPAQVASNRTARLVREAATPVYSTETKPREHVEAVEFEHPEYGNRRWSHAVTSAIQGVIDEYVEIGYEVSDMDHSGKCWCQK